jgi:hypothetical protein
VVAAAFLIAALSPPACGWGGKVNLARKYRAGQRMVYQANMRTHSTVRSDPPQLKAFLPPLPTEFSARQRTTVTVRAVHPDGVAEVESRFDVFEFQSNLPELLPEDIRESAREAQEGFSKRVSGQALTARYGRDGTLLDFQGAEGMLEELDAPLRETARQIFRLLLEQLGGNALYPGRRVKPGEEWTRKLNAQPSEAYPYSVEGESLLRYAGKTRYRGVKAAIIDFRFTNLLRPAARNPSQSGALAELEAQGMELDIRIDGRGQGRVLVALDDGRVLQNHSTLLETLRARLEGAPGVPQPSGGPATLQVDSETRLEVDGVE